KTLASLERGSRAPLVRPSRRARRRGMRGYMVFALALGGLVGGFALVGPDSSIPRERATSRRPSPPRVSAPVAAARHEAPPAAPGAPLVASPTTDVPPDEGGIAPGVEGDADEGPYAAARASAPRGEEPAPPEFDALALAAEVEAWGAVARDVPGLVPPRLVEL